MKNRILFTIVLIFSSTLLFSQENEKRWSRSLGVMLVPQGGIDLTNLEEGFSNQPNMLFLANFTKGDDTFIPFYTVSNSIGMAYSRSFSEDYGIYIVANKKVLDLGGYAGIGGTKTIGKSSIFVELGSSWNTWSPGLSIGAFIPLTFKF